jgi:carboxypeptidase A
LESIKEEFPLYVNVTTIGTSYEGRPLKLLKISKKQGNRAIFVEAHIHAREWVASATATWIINELLRSDNQDVKELADNIDWYFLPNANPDGYEYTRNSNRNWRKTRSIQSILCWGVDPNRNFGYNWMIPDEVGTTGSSTSPCSDVFSGNMAFSEPECFAIDRFLNDHRGIFDAYLALHSYDHSILFPYGNSKARVPNFEELQQVGNAAAEMLKSKNGTIYRVGNQAEILYSASGNAQDHAYGQYGIPISFTYEMRGNGDYGNFGFFLPPEYIIPNAAEVMESFIGLVTKAKEFGRFQ